MSSSHDFGGAPICAGCVKPGDLKPGQGSGSECTIAGTDAYCVGSGEKAIVISTDIFSWGFPNTRAVADQYAAAGYSVYIARTIDKGDEPDLANFGEWFSKFGEWLQRNPVERACKIISDVVKEVGKKHKSIAILGFCYGAKPAVESMKKQEVQAIVSFHASFVTAEDAPQLKGKGAMKFQCAENDERFTPEIRAEFQRVLAGEKNVDFHVYPGTSHGFGIRPTGEAEIAAHKQAHLDTIAWLKSNF